MNTNPFELTEENTIERARKALQKYWGYSSFRPGQAKAIEAVMKGEDTLVLFPTGGGKSLCYQIPSVLVEGLTIVISPLIALMQDQVQQLNQAGVRAAFINSTIPYYEVEQRLVNARNGMYKLLYIAPERLSTDLWKAEQDNLNINLVAIDEAHCISEWGHDFRPSYREIRKGLESLSEQTKWIALTATATPEVKKDILESLQFEDPVVVTGGFRRPNLHWWVSQTEKKRAMLTKTVKKAADLGSGIVYSSTRKECEEWARNFTQIGITAKPYHGGLDNEKRVEVQKEWIEGTLPLVVATNAFGMGIDKPDCRYVVHYTMPFSLEAYYQEAGRAGRDGEISYPVLIFKESDKDYLKGRIERNYPGPQILQDVYNGLCDEMNLAVGSQQDSPEEIDLNNIAKRIKHSVSQVSTSIDLLQRLNLLTQVDLLEPRVGLQFIVDSDYLLNFIDESESEKGRFLDALFRQFGPQVFYEIQFLDVAYLTEKLEVQPNQLLKALRVFAEHDQLLNYTWQEKTKLIQVKEARVVKLRIDTDRAYHYRDILLKKIDYISRYASTSECREVFLRNYFGETGCKPCGTCDNCLDSNKAGVAVTESDVDSVREILKKEMRSLTEISKIANWNRKKTMQVLAYMQRENLIDSDGMGDQFSLSDKL